MKKRVRIFAAMLAVMLMITFVCSCGKKSEDVASGGELPYVKLKCYIVGNLAPQSNIVLENLNKMLKEKINAELEITEMSWGDYKNKYSLVLASGENIDLIYTSNWCFYYTEAKKGAFLALDDMIEKYAPDSYAMTPKDAWDTTKVNGHIYMMPQHNGPMITRAVAYREDLRKKYNVPEIKTFEDLEAYYDAIKANEKGMFPLFATVGDIQNLASAYMWTKGGERCTNLGDCLVIDYDDEKSRIYPVYESETYKEWANIAKRWYEKGFWSRDILSNKTLGQTAMLNGTSASCCVQLTSTLYTQNELEKNHPDWELGTLLLDYNGKSATLPNTQNGMAIPATSKNPERALMAYNLLSSNQEFYDAHVYGVEGVTYKKNEDGSYAVPDNYVNGEGYTFGGLGIRMGMNDQRLNHDDNSVARAEYIKYVADPEAAQKYGWKNTAALAYYDTDDYINELTSFQNVHSVYNNLLIVGADSNTVEKQLEGFKKEAETAGVKKIVEKVNEQKDELLKTIK